MKDGTTQNRFIQATILLSPETKFTKKIFYLQKVGTLYYSKDVLGTDILL